MQCHVELWLPHNPDHRQALPVVECGCEPDSEGRIWFQDSDEGSAVLSGCPQCLLRVLRNATRRIEEALGQRTESIASKSERQPLDPPPD
jgi:hypothetical protein